MSQVFWPTTFSQEVMLRVKEMASCSGGEFCVSARYSRRWGQRDRKGVSDLPEVT